MLYVQLLFCFCITVVSANENEFNIETCLKDNPPQTIQEFEKTMQHIIKGFEKAKEVVDLEKKYNMKKKLLHEELRNNAKLENVIMPLLVKSIKDKCSPPRPRDCTDIRKNTNESGVYNIETSQSHLILQVYCDMTTDGGGWTVIQKRFKGDFDFEKRKWTEYELGFGDKNGDHWLGNQFIHELTSSARYKLRIVLWQPNGFQRNAEYKYFVVGDSASKYKLAVGGQFNGNAGNYMRRLSGMKFSTVDQDNDIKSTTNCASSFGGWWFKYCWKIYLNGNFTSLFFMKQYSKSVMMIKRI